MGKVYYSAHIYKLAKSKQVTGVAFDALHCDENKDFYRFASVGEDCKLLLWDFSVKALHKPKQVKPFFINQGK